MTLVPGVGAGDNDQMRIWAVEVADLPALQGIEWAAERYFGDIGMRRSLSTSLSR